MCRKVLAARKKPLPNIPLERLIKEARFKHSKQQQTSDDDDVVLLRTHGGGHSSGSRGVIDLTGM